MSRRGRPADGNALPRPRLSPHRLKRQLTTPLQLPWAAQAFLFAYSKRDKTHAARHYEDDVPPEVKQRRLEQVRADSSLSSSDETFRARFVTFARSARATSSRGASCSACRQNPALSCAPAAPLWRAGDRGVPPRRRGARCGGAREGPFGAR